MKYSIFLLLSVLFIQPVIGWGQNSTLYNGRVDFKQNSIEVHDGLVFFDSDISVAGISIGRYQSLVLTPWIHTQTDSLALPPIILYGSNKYKIYRRTEKLNKNKKDKKETYIILKNFPRLIQEISYKDTISYQPWMDKAGLSLVGTFCTYSDTPIETYRHVMTEDLRLSE